MHGEPQQTGERAMGLIALITNSYLKGGGGADWRFCLLLSSILVDITNNSVYKGIIFSFEKRGQKWTGDVEPSAGYLVLFKWSIQHRLHIGYGSRKGKIQKIFCKSNSQCSFFLSSHCRRVCQINILISAVHDHLHSMFHSIHGLRWAQHAWSS